MSEVAPLTEGATAVSDKSLIKLTPRDIICLTVGFGIGWGFKHLRNVLIFNLLNDFIVKKFQSYQKNYNIICINRRQPVTVPYCDLHL